MCENLPLDMYLKSAIYTALFFFLSCIVSDINIFLQKNSKINKSKMYFIKACSISEIPVNTYKT